MTRDRSLESRQYDDEGRPLPSVLHGDSWSRPMKVEVREGLLWPTHADRLDEGPTAKVAPALLPAFLALADADDQAYARFARRWGMLGLCGCDQPHQHHGDDPMLAGSVCIERPRGVPDDHDEWPERISAWRGYVVEALAIVRACERPRPLAGEDPVRRLNDWIEAGRVQVAIDRTPVPRLHLGNGYLFGGLTVALLSLVMGGGRLAMCAGCGRWFSPRPRQVVGRLWCERPTCQRAKLAAASRDYRRRRREDPMRLLAIRGPWTIGSS